VARCTNKAKTNKSEEMKPPSKINFGSDRKKLAPTCWMTKVTTKRRAVILADEAAGGRAAKSQLDLFAH